MVDLQDEARAQYVQDMFARISARYALMNTLMTAGQDARWRQAVIQKAKLKSGDRLLDIATGTGEIAAEGLRQHPGLMAVGGDFTIEMMLAGRQGRKRENIAWTAADTLALPFPNDFFNAVTSGFLLRNVIDVPGALREQLRVTRPGGKVVVLESSPPKEKLLKPLIKFHLNTIIPIIGKIVTGHGDAYRYLPDSTQQFYGPESLAKIMERSGLEHVSYQLYMFGTIAIHEGRKPG